MVSRIAFAQNNDTLWSPSSKRYRLPRANDDERNERTHNLCIASRTGTPLFRPRSTPGPPSPPVSSAFGRLSPLCAPDDDDDAFSTLDDVFSTTPSFPRRSRSSRRAACFSPWFCWSSLLSRQTTTRVSVGSLLLCACVGLTRRVKDVELLCPALLSGAREK